MNTYDFDQTVFNPDSSYAFFMHCMKKYPAARRTLPRTAGAAIKYALGRLPKKEMKEQIFSFLRCLPDAEAEAEEFWRLNGDNIEPWYLKQKREDDIIISASPEFLLRPICRRLKVRLIATRMDPRTGKITGENCHGAEKARRFREEYPGAHTERFYSDSLSDAPMAEIADRAYKVKKDKLTPWPQ